MFWVCEIAEETGLGPYADHDGDNDWHTWRSPIYARCLAVVGGPSGELSIDV